MRKFIILLGLVVVLLMCLVPPMELETVNTLSESAVLNELGADADRSTTTEYVPVWAEPEGPSGRSVKDASLATQMLLLQVFITVVVVAGASFIVKE